jgi:hypothetical protein
LKHEPDISQSVRWLQTLWIVLHLVVPCFSVYLGVDVDNTGLTEGEINGLKGIFPFYWMLLLLMLILSRKVLPRRIGGMLTLLAGPPLMMAVKVLFSPEIEAIQYVTECGIIYSLPIGFAFTTVVLFGSFITGKKGPGCLATLAQLLFIVPFGYTAYVFLSYLWIEVGSRSDALNALNFFILANCLVFDSFQSFREILRQSVFRKREREYAVPQWKLAPDSTSPVREE